MDYLGPDEQLAMVWTWLVSFKASDEIDPALAICRVFSQHCSALEGVDHFGCHDKAAASIDELRSVISQMGEPDHIFEQTRSPSLLSAEEVMAAFPELANSPLMQPALFSLRLWTVVTNQRLCWTILCKTQR